MTTPNVPIVVIGSLNMDLVLDVSRVPDPGETLSARTLTLIAGGKGANQAVACARLGGRVALVGRVGADQFGEQLRRGLANDKVLLDHLTIDDRSGTGVALIMVDDSAQNRILIVSGANGTLDAQHVHAAAGLIDHSRLVLLQLEVPLSTVACAVEQAAHAGKQILLNPAPAQALPAELLARVDYLVLNETEASLLSASSVVDITSAAYAGAALLRQGVRHALVTLGPQGVVIIDSAGPRHYSAPVVKAVDTTAAGDTFIGGMAVGLIEGMPLDAAAQFAMQAASLSVTRVGAQTSIPYRHEINASQR
jgi:ribokinase